MSELGRLLMWVGGAVFLLGLMLAFGGRLPWFGKLPGDIVIQREDFTLYAPLGTMMVLSILLTIVLNVIVRWFR